MPSSLTGSGSKFFSAGMLHPKVRATLTKEQILGMVRLANSVFDRIEALPQVVIAALNGVTRAGAAELTLACDMRIAASHATFAVPEAKWGGFPGAGAPVRLPVIVGRARALELICTARELNAQEMERCGLTLETHAPDKLMDAAHEIADAHRRVRSARDPRRQAHRQPARAGRVCRRRANSPTRCVMRWNRPATWPRGRPRSSKAARRVSPGASPHFMSD